MSTQYYDLFIKVPYKNPTRSQGPETSQSREDNSGDKARKMDTRMLSDKDCLSGPSLLTVITLHGGSLGFILMQKRNLLCFLETNISKAALVRVRTVVWDLRRFHKRFSCHRTKVYGLGKLSFSTYGSQKGL